MQAVDIELLRQAAILVVNEVELQQLGMHLGLPTDGNVAALLAQVAEQTENSVVLTSALMVVWPTTKETKSQCLPFPSRLSIL